MSSGFIARAMRKPLVHFVIAGCALFVRSNEFNYANYEIESVK